MRRLLLVAALVVGLFTPTFAAEKNPVSSLPYARFVAVSPSDTVEFGPFAVTGATEEIDGIYVGTAGNLAVAGSDNVVVTYTPVATGTVLAISPRRIMSTGTTASNIIALFH